MFLRESREVLSEFCYRNKMEFSFGDAEKDGPLTLGLHKKGSTYDVLTASDCKLVHEDLTKILTCVLDYCKEQEFTYYHKMRHEGYLRHLAAASGKYNRGDPDQSGNDYAAES